MVEAGEYELRDHPIVGGDLGYMVECVYRAMEYARLESLGQRVGLSNKTL